MPVYSIDHKPHFSKLPHALLPPTLLLALLLLQTLSRPFFGADRRFGIVRPLSTLLGLFSLLFFGVPNAVAATAISDLQTFGGDVEIAWNRALMRTYRMTLGVAQNALDQDMPGFDRFALNADTRMSFLLAGRSIRRVASATITVAGGYEIAAPGSAFSFKNFTLQLRPDTSGVFDVIGPYGEILFFIDNAMIEPQGDGRQVIFRSMDMRIAPALAHRIGLPAAVGQQVATIRLRTQSGAMHQELVETCPSSDRWPGAAVPAHPGEHYRADVFLQSFALQLTACENCSGKGGAGKLKITPVTILRNNTAEGTPSKTVESDPRGTSSILYSADVPWRRMFSRPCPPYGNDQHPYLTWALYRLDSDGGFEQVAHAGVKHAHLAQNNVCLDNPQSNHVLGRGCSDVYGTGDNDAGDALGPRAEIIPATGKWGRCGSIYDPFCKGSIRDFKGYDSWAYRLAISESAIDPSVHPGARYVFEAWYVVRDDADSLNSMAHQTIGFDWDSENRVWRILPSAPTALGPALDEWEKLGAGFLTSLRDFHLPQGSIRVVAHRSDAGNKRFRYEFVVFNIDYVAALVQGSEPNLRILSARGVGGIEIKIDPRSISRPSFAEEAGGVGRWVYRAGPDTIAWKASKPDGELHWGELLHFEFDSAVRMDSVKITLHANGKPFEGELGFAQ